MAKYMAIYDPDKMMFILNAKPISLAKAEGLCFRHFWRYIARADALLADDVYFKYFDCENENNIFIDAYRQDNNEKIGSYILLPVPEKHLDGWGKDVVSKED